MTEYWLNPKYLYTGSNLLTDQNVLVTDGIVKTITSSLPKDNNIPQINLTNHCLMPAFFNSHTHVPMSLLKGVGSDHKLQDWLEKFIFPLEAKYVNEEFVYYATMLSMIEMLESGTIGFADMYFFPEQIAQAVAESGMKACIGSSISAIENKWSKGFDDSMNKTTDLVTKYTNTSNIHFALAPHAVYTVTPAQMKEIATYNQSVNLHIHTHACETKTEVEQCLDQYSKTPVQVLDEAGLLGPKTILAHMVHPQQNDIQLIKNSSSNIAHNPESNLKLASGIAPITKFHTEGINVAIGTDGAASNNKQNMFSAMRIASLLAKIQTEDATSFNAQATIAAATRCGFKAAGFENSGEIKQGAAADMIALELSSVDLFPATEHRLLANIVYAADKDCISHVWCDGKLMVEDGAVICIDKEYILSKCDKIVNQMSN